jgi:integrase
VQKGEGDEQALYVLLGATGMRISEALAVQTKHLVNDGRTIQVREQVDHDRPRIVTYLMTDVAYRDIDLDPDVAEYLRAFVRGKDGLLFKTRNGTPQAIGGSGEGRRGIRRSSLCCSKLPKKSLESEVAVAV